MERLCIRERTQSERPCNDWKVVPNKADNFENFLVDGEYITGNEKREFWTDVDGLVVVLEMPSLKTSANQTHAHCV